MTFPDRLSADPKSPHHDSDLVPRVAVALNGAHVTGCVEYCVSEGWVTVALDGPGRDGRRQTEQRSGVVTLREYVTKGPQQLGSPASPIPAAKG